MSNSDETKKNEQNPDFLWDLDILNQELAEEFQKQVLVFLKILIVYKSKCLRN